MRMLALVGDPEADAYELLFSFTSAENKAEFLRLRRGRDHWFPARKRFTPLNLSQKFCLSMSCAGFSWWPLCISTMRRPRSNDGPF